jgi:DNA-binding beta-propeller fold protein YncE
MSLKRAFAAIGSVAGMLSATAAPAQSPEPLLQLETKIPLGNVRGRIDHMAFDAGHNRLFIAELGNNSASVIDLTEKRVVHRIGGLAEPQGLAYVASTDSLYVANGADGSLRSFRGSGFAPVGRSDLGDDADNIRVDLSANRLLVGYGNGALAVIDPTSHSKVSDIRLKAHPESFQLYAPAGRVFANVPKAREIAVIDLAANHQIASWPMRNRGNFPMALDEQSERVLVISRDPPQLAVFSMKDGIAVAQADTCRDADDVFLDIKRQRVYVSCGDGAIDVFDSQSYNRVGRIPTISGARTSLFVSGRDQFFLAVRATGTEEASLWIFRPTP